MLSSTLLVLGRARLPALLLCPVLVSSWHAEPATAQPWPIKEFQVVGVEPTGLDWPTIARAMRSVELDPDLFTTIELPDSTRTALEAHLREAATRLESWGFPRPALEPVVELPDGSLAYRVYVVRQDSAIGGTYHGHDCSWNEDVIQINADLYFDSAGQIQDRFVYAVASHELVHAVQWATPFFGGCDGSVGPWITEGIAEAIGLDLARLTGTFPPPWSPGRGTRVWGARRYSDRLPVPRIGDEAPYEAYPTASFWRYLAEYQALLRTGARPYYVNGRLWWPAPGPAPNPVDYGYLARLLDSGPVSRDCDAAGATCSAELRWLDQGMRGVFHRSLRDLYPRFSTAFALYGETRVQPSVTGSYSTSSWKNGAFLSGCDPVLLKPDTALDRRILARLDPVASECWEIEVEEFDGPVDVAITAMAPPGSTGLHDLSAGIAGPEVVVDTAIVMVDADGGWSQATWTFTLPVGVPTYFVLSNAGHEPAITRSIQNMPMVFMALESSAWMVSGGGGGGSSHEVDVPLAIELDAIRQDYVFPFQDVCALRFLMQDSETGEGVELQMDHPGPIRPGVYDVAADDDPAWAAPEDHPGSFTGAFGIVMGSDRRRRNFYFHSGSVTIHSIVGRQLQGEVRVNGWRNPHLDGSGILEDVSQEPRRASAMARFTIVARDPAGSALPEGQRERRTLQCLSSEPPVDQPNAPPPDEPSPDLPEPAPQDPPPSDPGDQDQGPPGDPLPPGQPVPPTKPAEDLTPPADESPDPGPGAEPATRPGDGPPVGAGRTMIEFLEAPRSGGVVRSMITRVTRQEPDGRLLEVEGMALGVSLPDGAVASCSVPQGMPTVVDSILDGRVFRAARMQVRLSPEDGFALEIEPESRPDLLVVLSAGAGAVESRVTRQMEHMTDTRYDVGRAALSMRTGGATVTCTQPLPVTFRVTEVRP